MDFQNASLLEMKENEDKDAQIYKLKIQDRRLKMRTHTQIYITQIHKR